MYTMDLIHLLAAVLSMRKKKSLREMQYNVVDILSQLGHAPGSWKKQVSVVQIELMFPKRLQEFIQVRDV